MKKNRNNPFKKIKTIRKITLIILLVIMFFLGTAYSVLTQDLVLEGTLSVPQKQTVTLNSSFSRSGIGFLVTYYQLKITNNNSFPVSNWKAIVSFSGVNSVNSNSTDLNVSVDSNKDEITINAAKGTLSGKIATGETKTFTFSTFWSLNNNCTVSVTSDVDPEYVLQAVSTQNYSLRTFSNYYNATAKTNNNDILENFVVETDDIAIAVEHDIFDKVISSDSITTNVILKIYNSTNEKINNLSFDLLYNEKINSYKKIRTTDLIQTSSNNKMSSYKMKDNDVILPNSVNYYNISQFITPDTFKSFKIKNIKYEFIKNEKDYSSNTNTIDKINSSSENISNTNIVNNVNNEIITDSNEENNIIDTNELINNYNVVSSNKINNTIENKQNVNETNEISDTIR